MAEACGLITSTEARTIGQFVAETGQFLDTLPEDERPGLVIVGIMTDGREA